MLRAGGAEGEGDDDLGGITPLHKIMNELCAVGSGFPSSCTQPGPTMRNSRGLEEQLDCGHSMVVEEEGEEEEEVLCVLWCGGGQVSPSVSRVVEDDNLGS